MKTVIIGGIAAGTSAAAKLKRLDKEAEVVIYEKSNHVSFGACGLPYFVGGFFDNSQNMIARTVEKFRETGIEVFTGHEVMSVDVENRVLTVCNHETNETFTTTYDQLMVATGARSFIPPIKNLELEGVYTLRSMEDGIQLKEVLAKPEVKKVAIIGAGFIGLEAVEAAKEKGKEIEVFQLEDRILKEVFDQEITELMENELTQKGVKLHLNTMVLELEGEKHVKGVITNQGRIDADCVILATGVRPNTDFIKSTGIACLPNGAIIVDQEGRTSIEGIYAAGDCASIWHLVKEEASYIPLATGANKLGRIVGENLAGAHRQFKGSLGSSCIKLLDLEAGRTGLTEEEAKKAGIEYKTVFIKDKNQTDYYPGQEDIYVKLLYRTDDKVLIGGQVIGKKDAVQRANVLAVAITAKMTVTQLGMVDLCYAPPFARTWDVLNVAGNVAK